MSKSYDNVLPLFAGPDEMARLIRRFKTDSTGAGEPKDPESTGLFQIYREIAAPDDTRRIRAALEAGGMSWKDLKETVFELLDGFLARPRERYRELMADKAQIQRVLAAGAERARPQAAELLARVRHAVGREPVSL
jgi:tryptophanyl-tRNA synthetase